jgi:short-subunit dehydrogenase
MSSTCENIFITGASRGIGAALSEFYAKPGVSLGLLSKGAEDLEAVASRCRTKGAVVHTYVGDVADAEHVARCASDFQSRVNFVDLVIANAGIRLEDAEYLDTSIPARMMEVNYLGVVHTILPFIARMKERGSGHLAAMSSIGAYRGTPNSGAYAASKGAVNLWTEGLRLSLKPHGICVSTLCSGFVRTDMTKDLNFWMPGLLSPEEAANIIASAIHRRKRLVTFPWQAKMIWTLFRVLPGPLYDRLILWAKGRIDKDKWL